MPSHNSRQTTADNEAVPTVIASLNAELQRVRAERELFRDKAVQLDNTVFQMRALLQSGKGFSEILNLHALLEAFMAVCRERYGSISSTVLLLDDLDPDDMFYRVRAYYGVPDTYVGPDGESEETYLFRIPHDHGLIWQLIHQGDVFSVRDMRKAPRFQTAFRKWHLDILRSDVWVPLMRGSKVLGILTLGECEDGSQISEADYAFLQEIAAVAATNVDSTLKYEKNSRILTNLRTLYDVNQQLSNVNDFKQLTIETLASAVEALHAQKANLMLYNSETQRLEIKVVWGNIPKQTRDAINEGRLETKSFALGEGVAGRAAKTRKPIRANDRTKIEQVGRNEAYCILSVPLLYAGELQGVMTLTNKVKPDAEGGTVIDTLARFGEDDEQLMLSLADQAAVNLHKARLYTASITDRLTGLFNARHLETRLERLLTQRAPDQVLCLAVTDIDHFKRFNDTYGHKAGDYVLAETARVLRECFPDGSAGSTFRYGGEEFCVLLTNTSVEDAERLLDGYRKRIEEASFAWEGKSLKVTVSIGVAGVGAAAVPETQPLFEAADEALFASKSSGRNRLTSKVAGALRPYVPA